jgi:uncharacterized protein (TIGR02118 family)
MIKVTVLYANGAGAKFDMDYYLNRHIPMVRERLGAALKGVNIEQGIAGAQPGQPPAHLALCHLAFDSVESFQAGFAAHGKTFLADIPNYTNVQPVIQISEVKL